MALAPRGRGARRGLSSCAPALRRCNVRRCADAPTAASSDGCRESPGCRSELGRQQREIAAIDAVTLDELRTERNLAKAALAREIGKNEASIRRLLTAPVDPKLRTSSGREEDDQRAWRYGGATRGIRITRSNGDPGDPFSDAFAVVHRKALGR